MIRIGTALKSQEPPFHRCLVLSDPHDTGGMVVLVRITTNDGTWPDRDCILKPADWSELDHDSTCKFGPAVHALEAAVHRGMFKVISSPSIEVLRRVIAAGRAAAGMPLGAKKLLAEV